MTIRLFGWTTALAGTIAATLAITSPAMAATEIQWWHAMTGGNNDVSRYAEVVERADAGVDAVLLDIRLPDGDGFDVLSIGWLCLGMGSWNAGRRMGDEELDGLLSRLDEADWASPSACPGWTVADVVVHLVQTDAYATASAVRLIVRAGTALRVASHPASREAFARAAIGAAAAKRK